MKLEGGQSEFRRVWEKSTGTPKQSQQRGACESGMWDIRPDEQQLEERVRGGHWDTGPDKQHLEESVRGGQRGFKLLVKSCGAGTEAVCLCPVVLRILFNIDSTVRCQGHNPLFRLFT